MMRVIRDGFNLLDFDLIKFDFHSGKYRLWNVDLDLDLIKFDFNSGKYRLWNMDFHENKLLWHLFWCLFQCFAEYFDDFDG